jgi:hypothetical protein
MRWNAREQNGIYLQYIDPSLGYAKTKIKTKNKNPAIIV